MEIDTRELVDDLGHEQFYGSHVEPLEADGDLGQEHLDRSNVNQGAGLGSGALREQAGGVQERVGIDLVEGHQQDRTPSSASITTAELAARLRLLAAPQDRDLRQALKTELLRTEARIAMFEGIDGERGSPALAKMGNVSDRTAQLFIKELLDLGLVTANESGGRGVIVERDEAAIIDWYLQRNASG